MSTLRSTAARHDISHLPDRVINLIRRALKGEAFVNPEHTFACVRSHPHGHVAAVLGTLKQLGLHTLIARNASRVRDLVLALIVAGVIDAQSKLATARALAPESAVAVEVFEGSTSDPQTVASQVAKLRQRFELQRVVLVGDRGMLTAARIREDLQEVDGLRWITTLRAPMIRKLLAAGTVTPSLFDERDLAEVTSEEFPGERLIVCRNPLLAAQRQRKRQELLAATEEDLAPIAAATTRKSRPLRGAAEIGLRVGKVINRYKVAKHFVTTITDDTFTAYKDLSKVERARFRTTPRVLPVGSWPGSASARSP